MSFYDAIRVGAAGASTGYEVERSLRFVKASSNQSSRLERTPSSASNRRTATLSLWFKRADTGADATLLGIYPDSNNYLSIQVRNNTSVSGGGTANFCIQVQARLGSTTTRFFRTNRSFEDTSKFYHILVNYYTTILGP